MTFIEENSGKIAFAICLASAFPVVGTVYAMETNALSGSQDNVVVATKDKQNLTNTDYIEDDDTDTSLSVNATAKTDSEVAVRETVASEIQKTVSEHHVPAVDRTTTTIEEETVAPVVVNTTADVSKVEITQEEVPADTTAKTVEDTTAPSNSEIDTTTDNAGTDYVDIDWSTVKEDEIDWIETEGYSPSVDEYQTGPETAEETVGAETVGSDTVVEAQPEENATIEETEQVQASQSDSTTASNPYSDLNSQIAAAAQQLVGVTNGQWCTQVVQQALANAGVSDAMQLWPDQYASTYGYYTNDPQPGNLIYYNNGGRGVDHIAVYIGNGLAVHGNYDGRTEIHSAEGGDCGCVGQAQYIQVCR